MRKKMIQLSGNICLDASIEADELHSLVSQLSRAQRMDFLEEQIADFCSNKERKFLRKFLKILEEGGTI